MARKEQVAHMFDSIAWRYDFLNHFLSVHIDKIWRRKAVNELRNHAGQVLDVATGTADMSLVLYKRIRPEHITGIDISEGMLEVGREKITRKGLTQQITLQYGDSEDIPFADNNFDAVMVAFGVRNFEHLDTGLSEMCRVLKPGGKVVILEFSIPRNRIIRAFYNFYILRILPFIGSLVSKDTQAYTYLPESVQSFPSGPDFTQRMVGCGFEKVRWRPLTFGIASIYTGNKQALLKNT